MQFHQALVQSVSGHLLPWLRNCMHEWFVLCTRAQVDLAGPELRLAPSLDGLWENHRLLHSDRGTSG